ncbi:MAG: tyrosine--tRNA ligase [Gammaproteobacteria bacterium AqS3]|nr:tyrosine--tRNA ligase [Gammaproteobacteria bacterium AqS3]
MGSDLDALCRGSDEVISREQLQERLDSGRPLRVKAGFDPTAPDLHLGHLVLLNKLLTFQNLGHQVIFLIGDFTALIGDPSGRNSLRPQLSPEEIEANVRTYAEQVFAVLDEERTEVRHNSEWMSGMSAAELITLAASSTVARTLERDDFAKRYAAGTEIRLHELLYPLVQGHDSVQLGCDVELGGTDQKFNLLVGRDAQRRSGQQSQIVMTLPLLEGLDGAQKMSKSLGNTVGLREPPGEMFGKLMSVSDELMWRYFELISQVGADALDRLRDSVERGANPRDIKLQLAGELTERFHGRAAAEAAREDFISRFSRGALPQDVELRRIEVGEEGIELDVLLKQLGLVTSLSEARRMVQQGAVRIDAERIGDAALNLRVGFSALLRVGKRRFARVELEEMD